MGGLPACTVPGRLWLTWTARLHTLCLDKLLLQACKSKLLRLQSNGLAMASRAGGPRAWQAWQAGLRQWHHVGLGSAWLALQARQRAQRADVLAARAELSLGEATQMEARAQQEERALVQVGGWLSGWAERQAAGWPKEKG